jgi:hypothetical protein
MLLTTSPENNDFLQLVQQSKSLTRNLTTLAEHKACRCNNFEHSRYSVGGVAH